MRVILDRLGHIEIDDLRDALDELLIFARGWWRDVLGVDAGPRDDFGITAGMEGYANKGDTCEM